MSYPAPNKAPWMHRVLLFLLAAALATLIFWLTGFVLSDIGEIDGPDYESLRKEMLDPALLQTQASLAKTAAILEGQRNTLRQKQLVLDESTRNSQQTMNQLLDFQRLALEKNVAPSEQEQQALAESQQRFLSNQEKFQEINAQLASLNETLRQTQEDKRLNSEAIQAAEQPIRARYEELWEHHRNRLAIAKLCVLVPLLLLAGGLYLQKRPTLYRPLIIAFALAIIVRTGLVMHEYFPPRWFKYVLISVAILIVLKVLIHLIRAAAFPRPDLLLRRYREAYERMLCPACDYPMRRGPLRNLFWTRRSVRKLVLPVASRTESPAAEQPYTCPSCATKLFEPCESCSAIRASLLPACDSCGHTRPVVHDDATTA